MYLPVAPSSDQTCDDTRFMVPAGTASAAHCYYWKVRLPAASLSAPSSGAPPGASAAACCVGRRSPSCWPRGRLRIGKGSSESSISSLSLEFFPRLQTSHPGALTHCRYGCRFSIRNASLVSSNVSIMSDVWTETWSNTRLVPRASYKQRGCEHLEQCTPRPFPLFFFSHTLAIILELVNIGCLGFEGKLAQSKCTYSRR